MYFELSVVAGVLNNASSKASSAVLTKAVETATRENAKLLRMLESANTVRIVQVQLPFYSSSMGTTLASATLRDDESLHFNIGWDLDQPPIAYISPFEMEDKTHKIMPNDFRSLKIEYLGQIYSFEPEEWKFSKTYIQGVVTIGIEVEVWDSRYMWEIGHDDQLRSVPSSSIPFKVKLHITDFNEDGSLSYLDTMLDWMEERRASEGKLHEVLEEMGRINPNAGLQFDWVIHDVHDSSSAIHRMKLRAGELEQTRNDCEDWVMVQKPAREIF